MPFSTELESAIVTAEFGGQGRVVCDNAKRHAEKLSASVSSRLQGVPCKGKASYRIYERLH
jgi:hypothetical protein